MRLLSKTLRALALVYLLALIVAVAVYKAAFFEAVMVDPYFVSYGLVVAAYILSRFGISLFYRPGRDQGIEPTVAIVVPAFNEAEAIAGTVRAALEVDYPEDRLDVVVVDDGSTDATSEVLGGLASEDWRLHVVSFPENRGKRAAMAAGVRETDAELVAFVDSDSVLDRDAVRVLVQRFADPEVGAVAGHADVLNVRESLLTRMQAVRYFVAFRVIKAAESVFDAVTCCSGCFAAYRREAIMPHLEAWEGQTFLGRPATFGDDRSLTNYVLRDWKVPYEAKARSRTIVPAEFRQFLTQQARWKRSWTRESLIVSRFVWSKHPIAAASTYVGIILPLLAPITAARALFFEPFAGSGATPLFYLLGIYAMALVYGLYYTIRHRRHDGLWAYGVLFVFFYLTFLVWQTYYAMLDGEPDDVGDAALDPRQARGRGGVGVSRVVSALRHRGGKLLSALVLVASIAPVAFVAVPMAQEEYQSFSDRYLERDPLPAPEASVPGRLERLAGSVPAYRRQREVPVLVYHGIGDESRFSISQDEFARQAAMLDRAGFRTISIAEYAAFLDGETAGLPPRPVLITFDDGQLSSFRGADAVLERHGMRAVMYAIAGSAEEGSEFYLSAEELREMAESGRWDIQLHAGDGHHKIAYDAKGRQGPFYTYRAYADGGLESFAEYRRRVVADLHGGEERLAAEIPAFSTDTFSFPFGAYGQSGNNDKRIRGFLTGWLGERYGALFHQPSKPRFTTPGAPGRVLDRFEIDGGTSATELARWLESGA